MIVLFAYLLIANLGLLFITGCDDSTSPEPDNPLDMPYAVEIDPADFVDSSFTGNEFFPLSTGTTYIYEGRDEDGLTVRVEEEYTGDTRVVLGVTCVVVNAREYVDGDLVEDTFDWYAQDKLGNVWYFGEFSQEIENGEVVDTHGSWEAGIDGALPGVIMLAHIPSKACGTARSIGKVRPRTWPRC